MHVSLSVVYAKCQEINRVARALNEIDKILELEMKCDRKEHDRGSFFLTYTPNEFFMQQVST